MKTLKVLLQEVVSGIKAWVNSNFAQESNTVHKTGNETVNGVKTFTGEGYFQNGAVLTSSTGIDITQSSYGSEISLGAATFLDGNIRWWGNLQHCISTECDSVVKIQNSNWRTNGSQGVWQLHFASKKDFSDVSFYPWNNNIINLGKSGKQWNNVYAKNYYYNGTAWGLDKANEWTGINTFSTASYGEMIRLKNTSLDLSNGNLALSSAFSHMIWWDDKNNTHYAKVQAWTNDNSSAIALTTYYRVDANTVSYSSLRNQCSDSFKAFFPETNADTELGTSTNKWKSFNDVNPGALSLPNSPGGTGTENVNYYDLSGNITIRDGSGENVFTASCDGWIAIGTFATWLQISNDTLILATTANPGADGFAQAFLPVRAGNSIRVLINQTSTQFQSFKLLPCQGNV